MSDGDFAAQGDWVAGQSAAFCLAPLRAALEKEDMAIACTSMSATPLDELYWREKMLQPRMQQLQQFMKQLHASVAALHAAYLANE